MTTGNGGPAFEHWRQTGKYLWEGTEYSSPPHQLEIDLQRGVLYLHSLLIGRSSLRVCRIPDYVMWPFIAGTGPGVIDLKTTPERAEGHTLKGRVEREPVFLDLPAESIDDGGSFAVRDIADTVLFVFHGVPGQIIKDLWLGEFADITVGWTKE